MESIYKELKPSFHSLTMDKAATFNCNECEKTFSRNDNLNRHIKRVHEKLKQHQCAICSKSFSRKQHRDYHLRTCSRYVSLPTEQTERITKKKMHQLEFKPIHRPYGFGAWHIHYPEEYRFCDHKILLKTSALAMKDIIQKQLYEKTKRLKYTMSIHTVFTKAVAPDVKTELAVVLHSDPTTVYDATNLEKCLINTVEDLYKKIEEYEGIESGWVIDYLVRLDTGIYSF